MIIDFHVHGKISRKYSFDKEKFLLTVNEAKEEGLDSIALTEHCHAENFYEGLEFLESNYELMGDCFNVGGFKVFYGMEVTTKQELDILFIGKPGLVIELRDKVISNLNGEKYIDINDLFKLQISNEILVILAHPFRKHLELPILESYILNRFDAMEINAKDLYKKGMEEMYEKVYELAKKLNLPVVCGSDTHYFIQMSSVRNIFNKSYNLIEDIKKDIKSGEYRIEISPELKIRVKSASIIKRMICDK